MKNKKPGKTGTVTGAAPNTSGLYNVYYDDLRPAFNTVGTWTHDFSGATTTTSYIWNEQPLGNPRVTFADGANGIPEPGYAIFQVKGLSDDQLKYVREQSDHETRVILHGLACGTPDIPMQFDLTGLPPDMAQKIQECEYTYCPNCGVVL